jgi:molecular chaperone GrpE (heat shock protein)
MNSVTDWNVPKWPFLCAAVVLLAAAWALAFQFHPPQVLAGAACVVLGSLAVCLPYILEYRASSKLVEVNAIGAVTEKLQAVQKFATQIGAATDQWAMVQENTKGNCDKTVTAAREIAERMTSEIRGFNEFQVKLNDTEKAALRLEVEKLRRTETDWLQVVARILDHVFALHNAAIRAGNPELADQIGNFQNACRESARRVGLALFNVAPNEKFDPRVHRAHGVENPPTEALVAETLAPGISYQGRLVRHALVRLQNSDAPATEPAPVAEAAAPEAAAPEAEIDEPGQLPLEHEK